MAEDVRELFSKETESHIINMQTMKTAIEDLFYSYGLIKESVRMITECTSWIVNMLVGLEFPEVRR